MRLKNPVPVLLALVLLGACTTKPKTDAAIEPSPAPAPVIADPTPPSPPNSVEVPVNGLKDTPAFMVLAIGGLADDGEKERIEMQDTFRLFRTDATAQDIVSFYAKEMKDRGLTTDNQVARSGKVGLVMQDFWHAGNEALFLIVSEPEDPQSADPTQSKRHVALLPAKVKKPKS